MLRPIALKQLNRLTSIDTYSCHDGLDATHKTAVLEVPGSIFGFDKEYYVCFVCFVVVFLRFGQKLILLSYIFLNC